MEELFAKWDEIKESIRIEHVLSSISYKTWIVPLSIYDVTEDTVYIQIPTELGQSINFFNSRFGLPFKVAISEAMQKEYEIVFVTKNNTEAVNENIEKAQINNEKYEKANLNPKYTFDSFVIGPNNRFAHSAALAVAESPGEVYNPLFLYGGVGLGKTHLMHSIGRYIIDNNSDMHVLYVTSEQFTNEVIEMIRMGKDSPMATKKFRDKYRNVDVLLVDDIQFIIGKDATQQEFFNTFNQLHEQKKQIIMSSDKPPKDMDILEERYKSRFGWGLIADIKAPDFETKMAILKNKMEQDGYNIEDEILTYIAENINSNIRELEGALNKLIAFSNLENKKIDIDLAKEALKDIVTPNAPLTITPENIIKVVCDHYNVTYSDIISSKRNKELAIPRHIIMYLCRNMTDSTLQDIGNILGKRDHTTVMNGVNSIDDKIRKDEAFSKSIDTIINILKSNL